MTIISVRSLNYNVKLCFSMEDLSFVPDLPSGPLDKYRKTSSFDWKRLKLALEGDNIELLKLKVRTQNVIVLIHNHCTTFVTNLAPIFFYI